MTASLVVLLFVYVVSMICLPFPSYRAVLRVARSILGTPNVPIGTRLSMLGHLIAQIGLLPIYATFWLLDKLVEGRRDHGRLVAPVFIVGQPRSGTTFLLRTLSLDRDNFVSAKHFEWRYPSILFWRLLDALDLRQKLENVRYWPHTPLGDLCDRIHPHRLGMHEELGIFLEEKFFLHYFVFRRYPFVDVLAECARWQSLRKRERDAVLDTVESVMKKVCLHRGEGRTFLSKENESVAFHEDLLARFPDARFIFIARPSEDFLKSYRMMSVPCTTVKHGMDPRQLPGWDEANMAFRLDECRRYVSFAERILASPDVPAVAVRYDDLIADLSGSVERMYEDLGLTASTSFRGELRRLEQRQRTRVRGYENADYRDARFAFFDEFVESIRHVPERARTRLPPDRRAHAARASDAADGRKVKDAAPPPHA